MRWKPVVSNARFRSEPRVGAAGQTSGVPSPVRTLNVCLQAVAAEFQNESAAALAAAATKHLQEAEQAKNGGDEHW